MITLHGIILKVNKLTDNSIINDRDQERLEQESEWKMLIEDVNPMSDDEREIFK